jgi:DNA-directed RNA polymerase subunit F
LEALAEALKNTDLDKLAKALLEQARKLAAMSPQELEKLIKELEQLQKMAKYLDMAGAG